MSEQPTGGRSAATLAEQLPAIESLAALAGMLGHLPGAYFTMHHLFANRLDVQADSPADFEVWREALQVPAETVELHTYKGGTWLKARTTFHGTEVELTSHGLLIDPDDAKSTPQQDAEDDAEEAPLNRDGYPVLTGPLPAAEPVADTLPGAPVAPEAAADFRRSVDAGFVTLPEWGPTPAPAVADVETGGAL
jgi:hypothetical protein